MDLSQRYEGIRGRHLRLRSRLGDIKGIEKKEERPRDKVMCLRYRLKDIQYKEEGIKDREEGLRGK